jgi:hypothetical protein
MMGPAELEPSVHLLCPHCKNPIELVKLDPRAEITCTSCGSSFRIDEGSTTGWIDNSAKTIGRFSVIETVGHGGFGTVLKAHNPQLDRTVAIRVPCRGNIGEGTLDPSMPLTFTELLNRQSRRSLPHLRECGLGRFRSPDRQWSPTSIRASAGTRGCMSIRRLSFS